MSVKSEGEIQEWEKKDYIHGVKITTDNLFDLIQQYVHENNIDGEKRDLNESEDKLHFYLFRWESNLKTSFQNIETAIYKNRHDIVRSYTRIIETQQYKASDELNENMKSHKSKVTRYTNKMNYTVRFLIDEIKRKRDITNELLFLQDVLDIFDEIKYGHTLESDYEFLKIAGYGNYRNKRIEGRYNTDVSYDVKRIHEILDNPKEAKSSLEIHEENMVFFEKAEKESKQFISDNIKQEQVETENNSYLDRNLICVHCEKQFKSRNTRLSFGKQVKNLLNHIEKEHDLRCHSSWRIKKMLEDAI